MKILFNLTSLSQEGISPLYFRKIKEYQKLNNQIDIFFGNQINKIKDNQTNVYDYNRQSKIIKKLPKIKHKYDYALYSLYQNIKAIFQIKKFKKYNIFYSPSSVLDLVITPFFIKIRYPKIIWTTVFDNIVPFTDPGNKITRFLAWIFFHISLNLIRHADLIFTISPELKQYLINKHFDKNKIVVTGNGVEIDLLKTAKKNKQYEFDALFIGRINETKGIFDMLKVLKIIKKTYPKFTLAILGDGDQGTKNKFKKQIKKLKLEKNIKMLGFVSGVKKFEIIKSSKSFWFLSISKSESFGIALMEAVSCGLPAFAYKTPVFTKIYKNNEVVFSPIHQTNIVAKKILRLFKLKNFTNKNGTKLLGQYSWNNVVKTEFKAIKYLLLNHC